MVFICVALCEMGILFHSILHVKYYANYSTYPLPLYLELKEKLFYSCMLYFVSQVKKMTTDISLILDALQSSGSIEVQV